MPVEVLLMKDVDGLGEEGSVASVAAGYARNYLFPKQLAAPVTEATKRRLAKLRRDRDAARADELRSARDLASRIGDTSLTLRVKVGADEKLFGSVTNAQIAEGLATLGFDVDRHKIELHEPIRELGVFSVRVRLHPEIIATLKVWIVEE